MSVLGRDVKGKDVTTGDGNRPSSFRATQPSLESTGSAPARFACSDAERRTAAESEVSAREYSKWGAALNCHYITTPDHGC